MKLGLLTASALLLSGCAGRNLFTEFRPPFASINEALVPVESRRNLAAARHDFDLARSGIEPIHAPCVGEHQSRVMTMFRGEGYYIIKYDGGPQYRTGAKIFVKPALTGRRRMYVYDDSWVDSDD